MFRSIGLTDVPACGTNAEVLAHHGLDAGRRSRRSASQRALVPQVDRRLTADRMYPDHILHWIDDAEVASASGATFEKRSPIDDRVVATVARGIGRRCDARRRCRGGAPPTRGRGTPAPRRGEILGRAAALLRAKEREFGEIVQTETGKPWKNAVAEVASSADLGVFMEGEGSRLYGKTMTSRFRIASVRTERAPIGVCAAIMPFNSPLAGVAWKAFPALLCGNAVVAKSHELTPYTAVAFGKLLQEAGLPRGVYSVVQGFGPEVGTPLVEDDRVGLVSFTGSVADRQADSADRQRAARCSRRSASSSAARTRSSSATMPI